MSDFVTGHELGNLFCSKLGIDPEGVAKVTLECNPRGLVKLVVERFVTEEDAEKIKHILLEYRLERIEQLNKGMTNETT